MDAAVRLGVEVVLLHDRHAQTPEFADQADLLVTADLSSPASLREALVPLHEQSPFAMVVSLTESGLLPAAVARQVLDLPGNTTETVCLLKDKARMRTLLNAHGVGPVAATTPASAADLEAFCARVGAPVILKPLDGVGSRGIHRVEDSAQAAAAWQEFTTAGFTRAVAEELLVGPEVSVEAFTHQGVHTVLAVTDKIVDDHYVETGHTMPSLLPADQVAQVTDLVSRFLDTVGLVEGPSHTEVKFTPAGPRVIESHDRVGGDRIRVLLDLSLGVNLPAATVGCPLGLVEPPRVPRVVRGAAIRFLAPPPGRVTDIHVPQVQPPWMIQVEVAEGDEVHPVRRSSDRSGFVIAEGPDAATAAAAAEILRDQVRITTTTAKTRRR